MVHLFTAFERAPSRHVFMHLDGVTKGPSTFNGPIGKALVGNVSTWPVDSFCPIENNNFKTLPIEIVDDLSTYQKYAYRIAQAVIKGNVNRDLKLLEVGPIVHSRWLT